MNQAENLLPEFSAEQPAGLRHIEHWSPQQVAAFRRAARYSNSISELAAQSGYNTKTVSDYLNALELPLSLNLQITKIAPVEVDDEGADLMDRIEGKSDGQHLLCDRDQRTVDELIRLSEAYYDVPAGSISNMSSTLKSIKARHAAVKVAFILLPGVTKVRMRKLFGGFAERVIYRALGKPDADFREFTHRAREALA